MSELEPVRPAGNYEVVLSMEHSGHLRDLGFTLPANVSREQYEAIGTGFGFVDRTIKFAIGDWVKQGVDIWGEEAYQFFEAMGISEESRKQYIRVAERIPEERRVAALTWSHHREVLRERDPDLQDVWLRRAAEGGWSREVLAEHMREQSEVDMTKVSAHERAKNLRPAAERVYLAASLTDDETYMVPREPMEYLRDTLGIIEQE